MGAAIKLSADLSNYYNKKDYYQMKYKILRTDKEEEQLAYLSVLC